MWRVCVRMLPVAAGGAALPAAAPPCSITQTSVSVHTEWWCICVDLNLDDTIERCVYCTEQIVLSNRGWEVGQSNMKVSKRRS